MNPNRPPSITNQLRGAVQESAQLAGYLAFDTGAWGATIPINAFKMARSAVRGTVDTINYVRAMPAQPAFVSVESVLESARKRRARQAVNTFMQVKEELKMGRYNPNADQVILWFIDDIDSYERRSDTEVVKVKEIKDGDSVIVQEFPVDTSMLENITVAAANAVERIPRLAA